MGILRIKDDVNEVLVRDPYELFALAEPPRLAGSVRGEIWTAIFVGLVAATLASAVVLWQTREHAGERADEPFAYFEIKVLDPDGHAVAGAMVRSGGDEVGVTDSFGEWRRFMHAKLGGTVALQISKKTAAGVISAVKNLAVPGRLPKGGDLEMHGRVQLLPPGATRLQARRHGTASPPAPEALPTAPSRREPSAAAMPTVALQAARLPAVTTPGLAAPMPLQPTSAPYASVWVATADAATPAEVAVAEAMRQRLRELGVAMHVASAWQIRLTDLAVSGSPSHLLKVEGFLVGVPGDTPQSQYSFLRNYSSTSAQTARDLLWATTVHVAKPYGVHQHGKLWYLDEGEPVLWAVHAGQKLFDASGQLFTATRQGAGLALSGPDVGPCSGAASCTVTSAGIERAPPNPAWQRQQLTLQSPTAAGVQIYVGGYQARPLHDRSYTYWGAPSVASIITVVAAGHVLYRARMPDAAHGNAVISLPSAPLSRR